MITARTLAAALLCAVFALGTPAAGAAAATSVPDIGAQAAELARANLEVGGCGTNSDGGNSSGPETSSRDQWLRKSWMTLIDRVSL